MNIIVTGAAKGIGKEIVLKLSQDKRNNILAISRSSESVKEFEQVKNVYAFNFDFASDNYSPLINECDTVFKNKIHLLINNAGLLYNKSIFDISFKEIEKTFQVNFFAVVRLIKGVLPALVNTKNAHIVNISSMGGVQGSAKFNGLSLYSSAKAALITLSECLAEELKESNIKVNTLALGAVQTEMLEMAFPGYKAPITAKEMADFVVYFSTQGNKYFNGKVIPVSLSTP